MQFELEKVLKRNDGSRVRIKVRFISDITYRDYAVNVTHCDKGKRKWKSCRNIESHAHRVLNMEERREDIKRAQLDYVTVQEIFAVKLDLWELMKPKN